jgi:hypothetical protein
MNTNLKRLKRFNVSRNLSVPRAFVEGLRVRNDNLFMSVVYRRSRVFCCYTQNFDLVYRIDETTLRQKGFGDYRTFTVNNQGEMVICSSLPDKRVILSIFDRTGNIMSIKTLSGIPLPESIASFDSQAVYFHSPFSEHPIYRYHPGKDEVLPTGEFPEGRTGTADKIGHLGIDNNGNLLVIYEKHPVHIQRYSPNGYKLSEIKIEEPAPELDFVISVLDFDIDPEKGNLYILRNSRVNDRTKVDILTSDGCKTGSVYLPPETHRLAVSPGGMIYSSRTRLSIWAMLTSLQLYGAVTTVDKYMIKLD